MTAQFAQPVADLMVLRGLALRPGPMAAIIAATAEASGLRPADILGRGHKRDLSHPRQVAMALCLELPGASLPKVARVFHRDHTTVLHARQAVAARMTPDLAAAMDRIRQRAQVTA